MTLLTRRDVLKLGAVLTAGLYAPKVLGAVSRETGFDWTLHSPDEVGMSRAGLEGVRAALQTNIDNKVIPGAVSAIARHNKLVWWEAQGVRDVETGAPMGKDDIFRMMSSTKVVTAVAVLMMMDEGEVSSRAGSGQPGNHHQGFAHPHGRPFELWSSGPRARVAGEQDRAQAGRHARRLCSAPGISGA
jgi:hypothetical protein